MSALGNDSLLRLPDVLARTALSRSQLYALVKLGRFPAPIELAGRSRAWIQSEVDRFIADRIAAARKVAQ